MQSMPTKSGRGSHGRYSIGDTSFIAAIAAVLIVCMLGGGSSRADVLSLLYLRPVVIVAIAVMISTRGPAIRWRAIRVPLRLLAAMAVIMALQLIPLPPSLWTMLPGRGDVAGQLGSFGLAGIWRPMSMVPELTLNSLMALLPPLAVLIGVAGAHPKERTVMVYVLLGVGLTSAVLGIIQFVSGQGYFYQNSDDTLPIGLFTNRNHQAALLAVCMPVLRIISITPRKTPAIYLFQTGLCGVIGLFFFLIILLTGSRSGMMLAAMGMIVALMMRPPLRSDKMDRRMAVGAPTRWKRMVLPIVIVLAPITILVSAYVSGRAVSVNRFQQVDAVLADQRIIFAPLTWNLAERFFPIGSGFGSFDRVYRLHEPDWALHQNFFNHAHNDLVEAIITGGLPFLIVIGIFLFWFVKTIIIISRRVKDQNTKNGMVLYAGIVVAFLLASLFDYHIRTPLIAIVFVYACGCLAILKATEVITESGKPKSVIG